MKHSLLPGRQSIYSMKTLALLCFLLVLVCSETDNEEPVPHLTDFHLFLDVSFYLPQLSWGQVMFLDVSVILFTGGGLPQCLLGYPPRRDTPREWAVYGGRYGQQAGGTHPTGMHSYLKVLSIRFYQLKVTLRLNQNIEARSFLK